MYLKITGLNLIVTDSGGFTALMWACFEGNFDVVKSLLDAEDLDINMVDDLETTALMWACVKGHTRLVKAIL